MDAVFDDLASKGQRYAFTLSASPVTLMASLAGGWRAVGSMRPAHRNRPGGLLGRLPAGLRNVPFLWRYADALARVQYRLEGPPFLNLDRRAPGLLRAGVRVEQTPRVEAMAGLVHRLGHDGRIRHARDESYLAWRYRNPLHEYRFLFRESDRLEGYLVLQAYRQDPGRGVNIVDWEATTPEIREELLRAAVEWGGFSQLTMWTGTLPSNMLALASRAGFVPVDSGSRMRSSATILVCDVRRQRLGSDMTLGGRRLLDPANWDMRMVYSMAG